ncbi:MAG: DUF3857 domain-containing protein [Gemmatimonadota bacterium]
MTILQPPEGPTEAGSGRPGEEADTELILVSVQDRAGGPDTESYVRLRYRVRGAGAVQEDSQVEIAFNPAYQELVLHSAAVHRGGRSLPQLSPDRVQVYDEESRLSSYVVDGRKTAVIFMEDVRVGDVIDYSYTIRGANPVFGGHYSREFLLGTSGRVGRLHARLLWEREGDPRIRLHRTDQEPTVRRAGGTTEYVWDLRDTEPVVWERSTPAWYRASPAVQISDFGSWSRVAAWGRRLFDVDTDLPDELVRLATELQESESEPLARAEAALRFTQDEIRYLAVALGENSHRPYPPSLVLDRRYGDCKDKSLLLVTLLRAMGIEAHPALVSTVYREHVADFDPSAGVFDHVVVVIRMDGEEYWVDPTRLLDREPLEPGVSPYGAALVLAEGTGDLARMPRPELVEPERDIVTRLDIGLPGEETTMSVETTYRRGSAVGIREFFQNTPRDEITRGYVEYYADLYPGIASAGTVDMRDDQEGNEVVVTERYRIEDFWYDPQGDDELVAELYPMEVASSLPSGVSGRRSMPLALDHPVWIRSVTEARLEDGWAIDPEEVTVDVPGSFFQYSAQVTDDVLRLSHEYRSRADHVPPEAAIEHQRGLERMSSQIGFTITPPGPISEQVAYGVLLFVILLVAAGIEGGRRLLSRG